jgi:hypothetical protein
MVDGMQAKEMARFAGRIGRDDMRLQGTYATADA